MPKIGEYESQITGSGRGGGMAPIHNPGQADLNPLFQGYQQGLNVYSKGAELDTLGKALLDAGGRLDERLKNYERHDQIMTLGGELRKKLNDEANRLSLDPDFQKHPDSFQTFATSLRDAHLEQIKDPVTRMKYMEVYNDQSLHYRNAVVNNARKKHIQTLDGQLLLRQEEREGLAAESLGDPEKLNELITVNSRDLGEAVKAGVIDYDEAVKRHIKFKNSITYASARSLITTDPVKGLEMLKSNKLGITDPKTTQSLIELGDRLITTRIRMADHKMNAERIAEERALKQTREQVNKSLEAMYTATIKDPLKGEAFDAKLEELRDSRVLDDATYRHYHDRRRGDYQKEFDRYERNLEMQFGSGLDLISDILEKEKKSQVKAGALRTYYDLTAKGVHPREAAFEASAFAKKRDVTAIPAPEGLGLDGPKKYDPAEVNAAFGRLAQQIEQKQLDPNSYQFRLKFDQLKALAEATVNFALDNPSPYAKDKEGVNALQQTLQKADTVRRGQESMNRNQSNANKGNK